MRVIRLLSAGTVDENILALQKRKKVLGAKLLDGHHSVGLAHSRGAAADDGPEDLRVMNEILREALEAHGVRLMSLWFLLDREQPAIMRGPLIAGILKQFFEPQEES